MDRKNLDSETVDSSHKATAKDIPQTPEIRRNAAGVKEKFGKIRYENLGEDETIVTEVNTHKVADVTKTEEDLMLILKGLQDNPVTGNCNDRELAALAEAMQFFQYTASEIVVQQGDQGSHFFIVQEGQFDVVVDKNVVNVMHKGKAFGDVALIHNTARSATVIAKSDGAVWGVTRHEFRTVLMQLSHRTFQETRQFIENVKVFDMLTDGQKSILCNTFITETFINQDIVVEGVHGDNLYIIKEGSAKVSISGNTVRTLGKADYFGERALMYGEPRSATISAVGKVVCLSLGKEVIEKVLGNLQDVLFRNIMYSALQQDKVFKRFPSNTLDALLDSVIIKSYSENQEVLGRERTGKGVRFFIVLEGSVKLRKSGNDEITLERCDAFGDEYLLNPKKAFEHVVQAITQTKLALFTTDALAHVLGARTVESTIDYNYRKSLINKMYIFRYLSDQQLDMLMHAFQTAKYCQGELIIKEGSRGTRFYIVKEGEVAIVKKGERLRTCGKNDYFGERALIYNEPRSASVEVTSNEAIVWTIKQNVFLQIVQGPMLTYLEERIQLQDSNVNFEDLEVLRVVGRGTFGTVKLVKHRPTGNRYALKCVSRKSIMQYNQEHHIKLEKEILAENDHPLIVKLVKTYRDKSFIYFLTELVTGGELYEAIRKLGILNKDQAQFYLASMIVAIEYLHEKQIVYRDLKPENILLDHQGYIKLIDFGCAKKLVGRSYTLVGTPHYMAPEVIAGKGYTLTADIWSFGVCLYEFMCGPLPFGNDAEDQLDIFRDILTAKLSFPQYVKDEDAIRLMKRLMYRVPEGRIGCSTHGLKEIKENAFFRGYEWDRLLARSKRPPLVPQSETYAEDSEAGVVASPLKPNLEADSDQCWDVDF